MGVIRYAQKHYDMNMESQKQVDVKMHNTRPSRVSHSEVDSISNISKVGNVEQTTKNENPGFNTVTILVGVSVVITVTVTLVLVACILCLKKRKKSKKKLITMKYDRIITAPKRSSHFSIVSTPMQLTNRQDQRSVYNALDLVSHRPQYQDTEISEYDIRSEKSSKSDKLTKYHSFESTTAHPKRPKMLKKSKSATSLISSALTSDQEQCATVSFSLKYVPALRQLVLKLYSVSDLPVKTYGNEVCTTVYLFPSKPEGVRSKSLSGGPNIRFEETFLFDDMDMVEIEKSTLRIVLQSIRKTKGNRENFLGEYVVKCCDVDLEPDRQRQFEAQALRTRQKSGSTCEKYLFEDLGSLFVCIEYQPLASRLKVMVRRSANLPKSDKLIGRPGHYVIINLLRGGQIIKSHETRAQSGYNPIWNQPFLFDLTGSDVDEHYLDFIVMREKIHTKDGIVGHVTIGPNCGKSGRNHWREIISPRPLETAKWHSILPMFNFKPSLTSEKM